MTETAGFPPRQLWAEARDGPAAALASIATPLFRKGEPVAFIGGKLAAALIRPLADAGFPTVLSDRRHPVLADIPPEEAEYEVFGHGYGEVHTAREFRQLIERAARTFTPEEDRWREEGRVVDPFRPDLRYAATSDQEFDVLQERHLNAVRAALRRAKTLVVSVSQSEIWESRADGAVFPHWTTAAERYFDPEKHAIRALTVEETVLDLLAAVKALRALSPGLAIVLMVSPEPQLATVHPAHVQVAGALGKAVLRIAMEAIVGTEGVAYFPALEIAAMTAPDSAYGADGAIPAPVISAVVEALLAISEDGGTVFADAARPVPVLRTMPTEPRTPKRPRPTPPPPPEGAVEPAAPVAAAEPAPKPKPKAKPTAIAVVDAYSQAKEVEAREKAERRTAHFAAMGQVPPPDGEPKEPTLSQAERQVMRREKTLAREARRAAAAAIPPEQAEASAAARRQREKARTADAAPEVAATPVGRDDAAKARRKAKKARGAAEQSASSDPMAPAAVKSNPRRERKRAAKG